MDRIELWPLFQERARLIAPSKAISTVQGEMTFERLYEIAERLSNLLADKGVNEGTMVGLALPNSLAFVPAFLALLRLSAMVALVSPKYRESELQSITHGLHPRFYLATPALARTLMQGVGAERRETISILGLGELELVYPSFPAENDATCSAGASAGHSGDSPALIKFTSGSTGTPKGIALTAANVLAEAQNVAATLGLTPADGIYAPVPIFHSYGFDLGVLPMLFTGANLTLPEAFVPRRVLADLSCRDVTIFLGVPSMYRIFAEAELSSIPDLSHIRYLLSCTAPLPPDLIVSFYKKFHMPICQHYGSSETGAATTHVPSEVMARPASVGLPMKNVELIIRDENGEEAPIGKEGEVIIKSRVVAPGYIMGEPPGDSKFAGSSYRTGDIGFLDPEGFLYLRGRKDELINVGGLKVSPLEVVHVLESFPAVSEAAVIGVKDASGEEAVYAVVTLKRATTEQEILYFCRSRLSDYKIPRRIEIREEMPRGPSGKINLTAEDLHL
jgi:acyl-CoA synthetase (AMP-forming)/AMP-acid ligase II